MWIKKNLEREWFTFFATPAILWQTFFLLVPLTAFFILSFLEKTSTGWILSLKHYELLLNPMYIKVIGSSLFFSLTTTCLCIVLAYPIAYFIAFMVKKAKNILLIVLLLPSWANIITQVYAWFVLLQKNGSVSKVIAALGITSTPAHLLNNKPVIIMGLVYCYLPFMILPLYLSLLSIKKTLLEASADLGATDMQTFWRIIVPLSRNGLFNGILLVAVPAFGEYAAIEILGGGNYALWGSNIVDTFLVAGNYAQGAALTIVGIAALISLIASCLIIYHAIRVIAAFIHQIKPSQRITTESEEGRL